MFKWLLLAILMATSAYADSPPRGMVLLGITNSKFPVKSATEALKASPRPAFAFIIKSFGSSYQNVLELITDLSLNPVTVLLYGDCGPCRPPRRPKGLFPLIDPHIDLRTLDSKLRRANPRTLERYRKEWAFMASYLPTGPDYIFVPVLEDQLSHKAFITLVKLYEEVFEVRGDFRLVRNRLGNLPYIGNIEYHTDDPKLISKLSHGDIVTLDGVASANQRAWLRDTRQAGVVALLWEPEWQGLKESTQRLLVPPKYRSYKIPNINKLKQLLRE